MPNYPYTFQLPPLNVQDIPNDGVAGEFLGINGSGVLDWLTAGGGGTGDMLKADNLLGLASYPTARTNLGLGTGDSPTFANLTLTSPSLVSSAPVTISQTWNNAAVAFTGLKFNAAGTSDANSASGSLLLDLQAGGVSKIRGDKNGIFWAGSSGSGYQLTNGTSRVSGWGANQGASTGGLGLASYFVVGWSSGTDGGNFGFLDTILLRDSANTLALRNGANAQTFNVYGTYTSGASYARLAIACDTSGNATLTTQSTGVAGTVSINGLPVGLGKGNVSSNVAIGTNALNANTTGTNNVAIGASVLFSNTTGTFNFGLAENALRENTTGSFNAALGASALQLNTTGSNNTALGVGAGAYAYNGGTLLNNTNSGSSIFIGRDTRPDNLAQTNQIVIGYLANGIGSNSVVLGNDSITKTALKGNVGIGTTAPGAKLQVSYANQVLTGNITDLDVSAKHHIAAYTPDTAGINVGASLGLGGCYFNNANYITFGAIAGRKELATNNNAQGYLSFLTASNGSGLIERMRIDSVGNVGIGTTSPTSKLQVTGGDVEIETVTSGIIMKAAGTATRYRITLNAGGTDLVFTAI